MSAPRPDPAATAPPFKPRDADIDVFGITHAGKVRKDNQDHFLIASLAREMSIHSTSLPDDAELSVERERLASLAMVADGVGSGAGEAASRAALRAVAQYVSQSMDVFYASKQAGAAPFEQLLTEAAPRSHTELMERAVQEGKPGRFATTLTLWLGCATGGPWCCCAATVSPST